MYAYVYFACCQACNLLVLQINSRVELNVVAETYAEEKLKCRGGKLPSPSFNLNFFLSATQIRKEIWH